MKSMLERTDGMENHLLHDYSVDAPHTTVRLEYS
jgi:hypothetical protein